MLDEVIVCVEARTKFFGKYMVIPPALQPELDGFLAQVTALGEEVSSAAEFEQKFAASGLADTFNSLVTRCTPQAHSMTAEEKAYARQTAKEIFREDKSRILKEASEDILESVQLKAESEMTVAWRREMNEKGVLDDYTRATNYVEDAGIVARFLKGKFGKKR